MFYFNYLHNAIFDIITIKEGGEIMPNKIENTVNQSEIKIPEVNNNNISKESLMPLVDLPKPIPSDQDKKGG